MPSSVRRDCGKDWKDYTKKLAKKAGLDDPMDEEVRQFDRTRFGKTVSNDDWENPYDPDATIMRMLCGIGGPRGLQGLRALLQTASNHLEWLIEEFYRFLTAPSG